MSFRLNISAGELFDLISPIVFIISALVSIWVLISARKRFPLWLAFGWAVGTVLLPLVVFPLYLIVLLVRPARQGRWSVLIPCVYAVFLLGYVGLTFYRDTQSADAHLARATAAKLVYDKGKTIAEYKKALAVEDDAHVHKLLGNALYDAGYYTESISEFRLAEIKGDPDELIPYYLGLALESVGQGGQARLEFKRFLLSSVCARIDRRCEDARQRIEAPE